MIAILAHRAAKSQALSDAALMRQAGRKLGRNVISGPIENMDSMKYLFCSHSGWMWDNDKADVSVGVETGFLEGVMSRSERMRNEPALKPVGFALAAVVAGLAPAHAGEAADMRAVSPPAPTPHEAASTTNAAGRTLYHPDDVLVLDTPVDAEPLAPKPTAQAQPDLFDPDVPLGRG